MTVDKKGLTAAYKEKKQRAGLYVLQMGQGAPCWVGASPTLDTVMNRLMFELKMGRHRCRALQAAAQAHGVDALVFTIAEEFDEDEPGYSYEVAVREQLPPLAARHGAERL